MKYAIYSDGSYKNGIWGAGAVILQETPFGFNPVQELSFYGEDADGIRNVAGEIYGVLEALRLLFKINQSSRDVDSVTVYHDYEGLQKWADGEWKAKKVATQDYRDRVAKARQYFICVDTSCAGVVAENRKAALHRKTLSASLAEDRERRKRTGEE